MQRLLLLALFSFALNPTAKGGEADEKLILATYKLANEASTATGLVVVRSGASEEKKPAQFVVTANHVFDRMRGNACQLVSRDRQENGTFNRNEIRIEIRKDGKNLWRKHPDHDLAVLRLPDTVKVEALPFESLVTEESLKQVHTGDGVRLAVFPEQNEANGAGFPILRRGAIASFPLTPAKLHPLFLADTTTWDGDSGGPVIHETIRSENGHPLVIGIVHGKRHITDTVKESRFVENKTHYPLNISEITHTVFAREMIADWTD